MFFLFYVIICECWIVNSYIIGISFYFLNKVLLYVENCCFLLVIMVGGVYISGVVLEIVIKGFVNIVVFIGYNIGLVIGNKVFICFSKFCLVNIYN